MILVLASALAMISEPVVCEVTIVAEARSSRAEINCPDSADEVVEAIGATILAAIDLPADASTHARPQSWQFFPAEDQDAWEWPALQLYARPPSPPRRALSRQVPANCFVAGIPDTDGRLLERQVACAVPERAPNVAQQYERALLIHSAYRVAPANLTQCVALRFSYRFGDIEHGEWPDAEALCDRVAGRSL